jgi:excisionase family DNA binding protein
VFPNPKVEPTLKVERAAQLMGIGRTAAYDAATRGEIPTIKVGRRLLVPTAALAQLLGITFEDEHASQGSTARMLEVDRSNLT